METKWNKGRRYKKVTNDLELMIEILETEGTKEDLLEVERMDLNFLEDWATDFYEDDPDFQDLYSRLWIAYGVALDNLRITA